MRPHEQLLGARCRYEGHQGEVPVRQLLHIGAPAKSSVRSLKTIEKHCQSPSSCLLRPAMKNEPERAPCMRPSASGEIDVTLALLGALVSPAQPDSSILVLWRLLTRLGFAIRLVASLVRTVPAFRQRDALPY